MCIIFSIHCIDCTCQRCNFIISLKTVVIFICGRYYFAHNKSYKNEAIDYAKWENFAKVIKRAMIACENSGHSIPDDFPEVRKIVEAGVTTNPKKDYELSRYACYLIVQNGDPRKEVIALGQTYFAIQTYRQEVADHFNELDEDNRRLVVRGDIKQWNQMLAETAHNAGVITNEEFAIFQNAGYMGLYGGLDVEGILAAVYQSVFGGDVYLSLEEKVANLLFNEIGNSQVV
jgi:DNA-damage-inducible protein D